MKPTHRYGILLIILSTAWLLVACSPQAKRVASDATVGTPTVLPPPYVDFTLQTIADGGKLAYIGMGVDIDGVINPDLVVEPGAVLRIILLNGDGMQHDLFLPDFNAKTSFVSKIGDRTEIIFAVGDVEPGSYVYYCTVPGHRQAGQEGNLVVVER